MTVAVKPARVARANGAHGFLTCRLRLSQLAALPTAPAVVLIGGSIHTGVVANTFPVSTAVRGTYAATCSRDPDQESPTLVDLSVLRLA